MLRGFLDLFVKEQAPQERLTSAIKFIIIPMVQVRASRFTAQVHISQVIRQGLGLRGTYCRCMRQGLGLRALLMQMHASLHVLHMHASGLGLEAHIGQVCALHMRR